MDNSKKQAPQSPGQVSEVHRHSKVITGFRTLDDKLHWRYSTENLSLDEAESIQVRFFVPQRKKPVPDQGAAIRTALKQLENHDVSWLVTGRKDWVFDLDRMRDEFKNLRDWEWSRGRVFVEPQFEVRQEDVDITGKKYYETFVVFEITQEVLGMTTRQIAPVEIQDSLRKFRLDHPEPNKTAFVMMRFGKTAAHNKIVQGINDALTAYGINAVRADDKDWHADLYYNVLTCLHGCGFGIAVFERLEREDFNPNVSLEVGYCKALGKEVCLLKDQTLRALQTDLVGKLYKTFDPQDPLLSIPPVLTKWMKDYGLI